MHGLQSIWLRDIDPLVMPYVIPIFAVICASASDLQNVFFQLSGLEDFMMKATWACLLAMRRSSLASLNFLVMDVDVTDDIAAAIAAHRDTLRELIVEVHERELDSDDEEEDNVGPYSLRFLRSVQHLDSLELTAHALLTGIGKHQLISLRSLTITHIDDLHFLWARLLPACSATLEEAELDLEGGEEALDADSVSPSLRKWARPFPQLHMLNLYLYAHNHLRHVLSYFRTSAIQALRLDMDALRSNSLLDTSVKMARKSFMPELRTVTIAYDGPRPSWQSVHAMSDETGPIFSVGRLALDEVLARRKVQVTWTGEQVQQL